MKKILLSALFGWCVLTRTTTYADKMNEVDWKDVKRGSITVTQEGTPVKMKTVELSRRYFETVDDLMNANKGWYITTCAYWSDREVQDRLIAVKSSEGCDALDLSDFEAAKP